ncbi:MAG: host specificity factor TipJ family phage tail protein [Pseudomonadota bacterium]
MTALNSYTKQPAPDQEMLQVSAIPHPFSVERIDCCLPLGLSIAEILQQVQADPVLQAHAHVFINGEYVPRDRYAYIRPKQNCIVSIRMVPQGGGGKNPLRTVLSVAIMAAAPFMGTMAGTMLGSQLGGVFSLSLTQKMLAGGISFLGRLAVNAIAPPARSRYTPQSKENRTRFIKGAQNRVEPFANIPQVLGTHRIVPPLGAQPFTEIVGEDQYIRMLFVWGYGPLEIRDLKIGETPLAEFDDVEIETRRGTASDAPLSLYPNVVLQNDLHVRLTRENGYEIRTTEEDTDEISIDILFPKGLAEFNDQGNRQARMVDVEVQYAPAGTDDWSAGAYDHKPVGEQSLSVSPPGTYYGGFIWAGPSLRYYKRIDSVVIDRSNGQAQVIEGERVPGFDQYGNPDPYAASETMVVKPPQLPADKYEVARLVHLGDTLGVEIEDRKRAEDLGDIYESATDFSASIEGSGIKVSTGGIRFDGFHVRAKQTNALRRAVRFQVPRGQYDVRLRRLTKDTDNDSVFDDVYWTALRSVRNEDPVQQKGLAITVLRIRATDQLNGTIDQLNGVVSSIVPDWDGQSWSTQISANPAALFRHVLQGSANARPLSDDRIDLEKLQDWHQRCQMAGREFNAVVDTGQSVMDVLSDIAAAGRASPTLIDGRWAVVEDMPQTTPVQHFTPRNSYGFESERSFDDHPHALRVRFHNREKGWQLDERLVFDDGYTEENARKFEGLDLSGITDPKQVWQDGRYHIASARLRPESYSFYTDIEHIVCTRGDLIRLTHDAALIGLASARIAARVIEGDPEMITGVRLDTAVTMEADKNYVLRIRCQNGNSIVKDLMTVAGEDHIVRFVQPIALSPEAEEIMAGDLCVFGESGRESIALIVKSIEPQDNLAARITCVDAAPALHQADQIEIPQFDSHMSIPPELRRPEKPVLEAIQSGVEVLKKNTDGSFTPQIVITLKPSSHVEDLKLKARIRAKEENSFQAASIEDLGGHSFAVSGVEEGGFYDLEFRYVRSNNIASETLVLPGYEVIGAGEIPGDVKNFAINIVGGTAQLSWDAVPDIDLSHYKIKYSADLSDTASWNTAIDLVSSVPPTASSVSVPVLSGYYLIKAVDLGGRQSASPAVIKTDMADMADLNVVETLTEGPDFYGEMTNVAVVDGGLRFSGMDSIDDWPDMDMVSCTDIGSAGYAVEGLYRFQDSCDLGSVFTARLTAAMKVSGLDLNQTLDDRGNIDLIENWDNTIDPEKWSVHLQIRTTADNPADPNADWSPWRHFVIGDYTARGFDFRLLLHSQAPGITPIVSDVSIIIDMPDRVLSGQDIEAGPDVTDISFAKPFRIRPAIAVSAQDLQTGDYYALSGVSKSGFSIQFFDQTGNPVSRHFDYLAKGYGKENQPAD